MPRQKQIPRKLKRKGTTHKQRTIKVKQKVIPISKNTITLCQNWLLQSVACDKIEDELPIESDDNENKEVDAEIGTISLRKSLANVSKYQLTHAILLECEWKGCNYESPEEEPYFTHVSGHTVFKEILDTFACLWDLCKFESEDKSEISRHINYHAYHTKLKTYGFGLREVVKLPVCKIDSRKRNDIQLQSTPYLCSWDDCTQSFDSVQDHLNHTFNHAISTYKFENREVKTVRCLWLGCNTMVRRANLRAHVDSAHVREKVIACHNCGTVFARKKGFVMHCQRQVDDELRQFQCPECFKLCATNLLFREHAKQHMTNYKCDICGMTFAMKAKLALHIRTRHIPVDPFKCTTCGKGFKVKRNFELHQQTHTNLRYHCQEPGCSFSSKTKKMLTRHRERKHEDFIRIYRCHICDQDYRVPTCLTKHLRQIHGLVYPPGHSRFVYRQYEDGLYRLMENKIDSYNPANAIAAPVSPSNDSEGSEPEVNDQMNVKISYRLNSVQPETVKKMVTIVVHDEDADGNVIREKTLQVNEIFQD